MSKILLRFSRLKWFLVAPRDMKSRKSLWSAAVTWMAYCLKMAMNYLWATRLVLQPFICLLHSNLRPFSCYGSMLCRFSRAKTRVRRLFGSLGFLYSLPRRPLRTKFYSYVVSWRFPMSELSSDR